MRRSNVHGVIVINGFPGLVVSAAGWENVLLLEVLGSESDGGKEAGIESAIKGPGVRVGEDELVASVDDLGELGLPGRALDLNDVHLGVKDDLGISERSELGVPDDWGGLGEAWGNSIVERLQGTGLILHPEALEGHVVRDLGSGLQNLVHRLRGVPALEVNVVRSHVEEVCARKVLENVSVDSSQNLK
jgi:hypothetical protein